MVIWDTTGLSSNGPRRWFGSDEVVISVISAGSLKPNETSPSPARRSFHADKTRLTFRGVNNKNSRKWQLHPLPCTAMLLHIQEDLQPSLEFIETLASNNDFPITS